jgi:nitrite reductase/ring-hydroxylating ferredoxin subunit
MSSILNRLNLKILNILKYQIKSDISKIKTKKFTFNSKILGIPISLFTMFYLKEKTNFDNNLMCKNFKKIKLTDIESLQENEIREVKYGSNPGESILLMKYQSNYIALSSRCPHYGAPMKDGFLYDNLIKCPWHGASFEITTGLCESGPALDGLKKYEILQEAENYYALVDDSLLDPKVYKRDPLNSSRYVIVGGGPAGLACAETLRHAGYTGHIEIFSADSLLPYDRPILSKSTPSDPSKITLRDAKFFSNYDIEIYKNAKVSGINSSEKLIKLSNGETKVSIY